MFDAKKLLILLNQYPHAIFWVAYSGGLDSHVLLHALSRVIPHARLRSIHINHGWHSEASQWAYTCQQFCMQLGIHNEILRVDAQPKPGESPEAAARQVRYAAIAERLNEGDCVLTAHHRDDQAETVLIQSLRGAGLQGLAGMPESMRFAKGFLLRPLLKFTRPELQTYAQAHQLTWIEDSSNRDLRFSRNFIRHQILPLLQQHWPQSSKTLARVANHAAEASQLLNELGHQDWMKVCKPQTINLHIPSLLKLTAARRRNCLRYWLKKLHFPLPTQAQLQQIEYLLETKSDANPIVRWDTVQVCRYRNVLYPLLSEQEALPTVPIFWNLKKSLSLPPCGVLTVERILGHGICCNRVDNASLTIRLRQGGERFHLQGRQGSHPLKKLFQEWGVPPWQRNKIPLIYYQEQFIAVVGYGVSQNFLAKPNEWGYVIGLQRDFSQAESTDEQGLS